MRFTLFSRWNTISLIAVFCASSLFSVQHMNQVTITCIRVQACARANNSNDEDDDDDDDIECYDSFRIRHYCSSDVAHCGTQLWSCSIILCDWMLSYIDHRPNTLLHTVLELGCGVGLCATVLASKCQLYLATDVSEDALELCRQNVMNMQSCKVVNLDLFTRQWPLKQWSNALVPISIDIVLVSDVVFDPILTTNLVWWIQHFTILNAKTIIIIAIESRLNFMIEDMAIVDVALRHFLNELKAMRLQAVPIDLNTVPTYTDTSRPESAHLYRIQTVDSQTSLSL